jgi:probable addiction module antidote protein
MSKTTFSRFDAADYLRTEEDIAVFLTAAAEAGCAAHYMRALGIAARARDKITKLAERTGLTRQGLNKALSGGGHASLDTTMRVMNELGYRFVVERAPESGIYREKETGATIAVAKGDKLPRRTSQRAAAKRKSV